MLTYFLFRISLFLIGIVPFPVLYAFSDVLAFVLYRVLGYRKKVILKNLSNAFPQLSEQERLAILKKTYTNLSDITIEGIKGMSCSQEELIRRYRFLNPEMAQEIFQNGKSAIGLVAHYNNWEWGAFATSKQLKGQVVGVSKSIRNPYIDQFIKKNRARFNSKIVHMNETARALIENRDIPTLFVLIADQSPSNGKTAHWIKFLNQDTACLIGPDKIGQRTNYPAIYFDVQRVKRGFYEITASILHPSPSELATGKLTEMYMQKLEEIITRKPENWLWSHRRWKKKKLGVRKQESGGQGSGLASGL